MSLKSPLLNYISGTVDPTASAVYGEIGWLYVRIGGVAPQVYQKITTDAADTNWQAVGSSSGGGWTKYTVTHTALQAAALTNNIELFSLAAKGVIEAVVIKQSVAFAGTGITAYTVSVGIAGALTEFASAFDVFQAVGDTVNQSSDNLDLENFTSATSIKIAATSVGANLDQSTAGSVDVWVKTSTLP